MTHAEMGFLCVGYVNAGQMRGQFRVFWSHHDGQVFEDRSKGRCRRGQHGSAVLQDELAFVRTESTGKTGCQQNGRAGSLSQR